MHSICASDFAQGLTRVTTLNTCVLFTLLAACWSSPSAGYDGYDGYEGGGARGLETMMSMMDMMDNMLQLYRNRQSGGSDVWSYSPWGGQQGFRGEGQTMPSVPGPMPWAPGSQMFGGAWPQGMPGVGMPWPGQPGGRAPRRHQLNGIWQGESGEVLVIQDNRLRVFANADEYTDGWLEVDGSQLRIHNPDSGVSLGYEMALRNDTLALRDGAGQLRFYYRLSRNAR